MIPLLSRLFRVSVLDDALAQRNVAIQERNDVQRDRDRWLLIASMWAARAGELAAQNRCQQENVGTGLRMVEEMRAALNEIATHTDPDGMRVLAYAALGHEPRR